MRKRLKLPGYFFRDVRSGELLELFLVTAITALLLNRFFLFITGFPSIGGKTFHIAHMLWGGLLMLVALVLLFAFLGYRVRRLASVVAGIGFGLFIDELGKFITRDNNYFFEPTIGLIYLIFIIMFIVFRALARQRTLTQQEALLNALNIMEEAVIEDMDVPERNQVLTYLKQSDQTNPLVRSLSEVVRQTQPDRAESQGFLRRWTNALERWYRRVITMRYSVTIIDIIFIIKALAVIILVAASVYEAATNTLDQRMWTVNILQISSSIIAGLFVVAGVTQIRRSRLRAYELFSRSLLIDIFVTDFFAFYRDQFDALPGFMVNLALYVALRFLLQQEQRVSLRAGKT